MSKVKNGDTVEVHYTGKLGDGTVFDSSRERQPLKFKIGEGKVIPGFENGILGMEKGDSKTFTIEPEAAYGPRKEELTKTFDRSQLPDSIKPQIGLQLKMVQPDGNDVNVRISALDEKTVTIDANHPLAGRALTFDIELVNIG